MKKRLSLIISIIVIVGIIVGVTLALFRKNIFTQNVSFNVDGITITYEAGDNITGVKLIPVTTLAKGLTDGTAIEKQITVSSTTTNYFSLYLDVEILDNGLKRDYVKYQINKGNNIVESGNFAGAGAGTTITLLSDEKIDSTTSTYTLYIWIDGSVDNDETVENQNYKFILRADATDERPPTASEKIIKLAGNCTSYESGFEGICATNPYTVNGKTKYHEYRYIGGEVDNWVKFNNDDYRIIGVFDDKSHGIEGEYLVKLIMENPLMGVSWGDNNAADYYTTYSTYDNNWEISNANILLNEYFLNAIDTTSTYKSCSDWTYYSDSNDYKTKNCSNITGYGIQTENLRNYIESVTWYLNGFDYTSYDNKSRQEFYTCERFGEAEITNCKSGNNGLYANKVENKSIGLMYASDYLYASGYYASMNTSTVSSRYYGQQNWLNKGYEWTINPVSNTAKSAFVIQNGGVGSSYVYLPYIIRPTFYLKSTMKIKSGDGTYNNPFIIE